VLFSRHTHYQINKSYFEKQPNHAFLCDNSFKCFRRDLAIDGGDVPSLLQKDAFSHVGRTRANG
jgi:hypothetical protein